MDKYRTTVGLEIHAELSTKAKVFCGCANKFSRTPNSRTCPVCLGLPGSLPVLNEKVLEYALRTAAALNCRVLRFSKFDRKNYFYPDIPKNYQISQDGLPIASGGYLDVTAGGAAVRVGIDNIHIEEDAGKNLHGADTGLDGASLVDFNRSGVPLLEIVTCPDMHSIGEVDAFMNSLRDILLYTGVSDCKMEEGSLRFEANVSLNLPGSGELGQRVEIKNLNSFKAVIRAVGYEIERQSGLLDESASISQDTRLFDERTGRTHSMRGKEDSHDYRYFPEPDLVPVTVSEKMLKDAADSMPELPGERRARFIRDYGLSEYDAGVLTSDPALADYFEETLALFPEQRTAATWITGELLGILNESGVKISECPLSPGRMAGLLGMLKKGVITAPSAKKILREMFRTGKNADEIAAESGAAQINDAAEIRRIAGEVCSENGRIVEDFLSGREKAFSALVGGVMRKTSGRANPKMANEALKEELEEIKKKRGAD